MSWQFLRKFEGLELCRTIDELQLWFLGWESAFYYISVLPSIHVLMFYLCLYSVHHHDMFSVLSVRTDEQLEEDEISSLDVCVCVIACVDVGDALLV